MNPLDDKAQQRLLKLPALEARLSDPSIAAQPQKLKELTREHASLLRLKENLDRRRRLEHEIEQARELLRHEQNKELILLAEEELVILTGEHEQLLEELQKALVPPDPYDSRPTIMELRAGTGGDEAALFVGDCVRMYQLYADSKGWSYEILSATPSERGGFKEFIMVISGHEVYKHLRYEAGGHRVQRIPATETQGRIHTSAITAAVMPEADPQEEIKIQDKDLRIDTMRSSGAGGQHVNTTDSAVRITHLPTGIVVFCQQERSQIKNRDKAMKLLQAKLLEREQSRRAQEEASLRASQVGSGDRSDRIRTYNFPQNRVTDHRIELTLHNLSYMMNGSLDSLLQPLILHYHRQNLNAT